MDEKHMNTLDTDQLEEITGGITGIQSVKSDDDTSNLLIPVSGKKSSMQQTSGRKIPMNISWSTFFGAFFSNWS